MPTVAKEQGPENSLQISFGQELNRLPFVCRGGRRSLSQTRVRETAVVRQCMRRGPPNDLLEGGLWQTVGERQVKSRSLTGGSCIWNGEQRSRNGRCMVGWTGICRRNKQLWHEEDSVERLLYVARGEEHYSRFGRMIERLYVNGLRLAGRIVSKDAEKLGSFRCPFS